MIHVTALAGNAPIKSTLCQGFHGQAFLLEGEKGSGRHTLAKLLTRASVCLSDGDVPCGTCLACRKAEAGSLIDICEIPSNVRVDALREILETVAVYPNDAKRKVYIIDAAEKLGAAQQNILLKTLEEPPAFVVFILLCFSKESMLPTIRSRCTVFSLKPVTAAEATAYLENRFPHASKMQVANAVRYSEGYLGKAVAFLDSHTEEQNESAVLLCKALAEKNYVAMSQILGGLKDRELFRKTVTDVKGILKNALSAAVIEEKAAFCNQTEKQLLSLGQKKLSACASVFEQVEEKGALNLNIGLWGVHVAKECRRIVEKTK